MKRKEKFQWLPKELHPLKYEAISVPQGSVRLVKKTQERKSSTCYLLITKGVTSSSPVPLKTRRERESAEIMIENWVASIERVYCEAAWDSFLCWPPAASGETLMRPCPMLDSMGTIIGESSHPGNFSYL
ncbi:uncharacterized protein TNCV_4881731 [Trichonephila clavipes]|nr:uncharacterized protein TNCV_4881731 [Trichonephila clavipes]